MDSASVPHGLRLLPRRRGTPRGKRRWESMPRYFFHLRDRAQRLQDEEGRELPNVETARKVAVMNARAIICDEVLQGTVSLGETIEVEDEAGRALLSVAFSEAVAFRR
jgi:uncharacterized protein DUF6894